jgi:hypothetical protein
MQLRVVDAGKASRSLQNNILKSPVLVDIILTIHNFLNPLKAEFLLNNI